MSLITRLTNWLKKSEKLSDMEALTRLAKMTDEEKEEEEKKLQEAEEERLAKHLQEKEELESEEEAKEKLAKMTEEEKSELAAECDEKEKLAEGEDEDKDKLSTEENAPDDAVNDPGKKLDPATEAPIGEAKMKRMAADFRKRSSETRLAIAQLKIKNRLSQLRASAKITPAEMKKINIARLAQESEATQKAVLESYANREDVIPTGVLGARQAANIAEIEKSARMVALEEETRSHFKSLPKKAGQRRLTLLSNAEEMPDSASLSGDVDKDYEHLCALIDGDSKEEAKENLRAFLSEIRAGRYKGLQDGAGDDEKQLSSLSENLTMLQNNFEDIIKMVGQK